MKYSFYDKQIICETRQIKEINIIGSTIFKEILTLFINDLKEKNNPLLKAINGLTTDGCVELLTELSKKTLKNINEGKNFDSHELHMFVEELYNFWRSHERFFILHSETHNSKKDLSSSEQPYHERPYRSFNRSIEKMNHEVRAAYRDICENITYDHPRVYRQMPAGFQVGMIVSEEGHKVRSEYSRLLKIPLIKQILIEPPLILDPPMNKRKGSFKRIEFNPFDRINLTSDEWLCYPAQVGDIVINVYFHKKFMNLGISLSNLFDLSTASREPDAYYLFGIEEDVLKQYGKVQTFFYNDTSSGGTITGYVPRSNEYGYFGYLKKMMLTVHNIIQIKRKRMPVHGAMVNIMLKNGIKKNIIIIGDSGAGKSETIEALRTLSKEYLRDMKIIFDDMGCLEIDKNNDRIRAYGTETGAFVRLDDLQPGYIYGNLDRSIIMNPDMVNSRAVLPITTKEDILHGYPVDMILYANNYSEMDPGSDSDADQINTSTNFGLLKIFESKEDAIRVFRQGARMAKGTTSEVGLTESYFANPFGPPQCKKEHEAIAERFFEHFFRNKLPVGEIKTRLGLKGYEMKGPEKAAKALFNYISVNKCA
ncbi:phosphoenolpyruvate carboxykinase [Candidatus Woesearchaeota archaeon]|nr:phosphoenolpyruvate carboxykinase [Candidatus Woesearchaeota archaeon]